MLKQNPSNDINTTLLKAALGIAASAMVIAGCSSAHSNASSPFSMYSSPLLDGEMRAQRPSDAAFNAISAGSSNTNKQVHARKSSSTANTGSSPPASQQRPEAPPQTVPPALATSRPSSAANPAQDVPPGEDPTSYAADYAWSVYRLNNVELPRESRSNIAVLYRNCRDLGELSHENARVGDLAFFHNTFDANQDGRNNDWYTHVAIVETTSPSGDTSLLGYQDGEVQRFYMNLRKMDSATAPNGIIMNSALRSKTKQDAPFTQYLSSQLFAGYCSLMDSQQELTVIDNWRPGMKTGN